MDELEDSSRALAIVRFGRIVAVLAPDNGGVRVRDSAAWSSPQKAIEVDPAQFDLTDVDRDLFLALAGASSGYWSLNEPLNGYTVSQRLVATTRLEGNDLVERFGAGIRLTRTGERLAEKLTG